MKYCRRCGIDPDGFGSVIPHDWSFNNIESDSAFQIRKTPDVLDDDDKGSTVAAPDFKI